MIAGTKCETHSIQMQSICEGLVCGLCYADSMIGEPLPKHHPGFGSIDGFSGDHGRVWVYNNEPPVGNVHGPYPWTIFQSEATLVPDSRIVPDETSKK